MLYYVSLYVLFFFEDCVHFDIYSMELLAFVFSSLHIFKKKISIVHSGHHDCEICFTVSILSFMMSTVFFKLYICLLYMYVHLCMQIYQYWNCFVKVCSLCFVLHFIAYQPHHIAC